MNTVYIPNLDFHFDSKLSRVLTDIADADAEDAEVNRIACGTSEIVANNILTNDKLAESVACCMTESATQAMLVTLLRAVMSCDKEATYQAAKEITAAGIWQHSMEDAQKFIERMRGANEQD